MQCSNDYVIEALYESKIEHANVSTLGKKQYSVKVVSKVKIARLLYVNNLKILLIYLNLSSIIVEKIMIKGTMIC